MSAGLAVGERVVVIEPRHAFYGRTCTVIEPQDRWGMVTVRSVRPDLYGVVEAQVYWTSARRADA